MENKRCSNKYISVYRQKEAQKRAEKRSTLFFFVKITAIAIALLFLLLAVTLVLDLFAANIEYTLEAGDPLPSSDELSGRKGTQYDFGKYDGSFDKVGEYVFHITDGKRKIKVTLTVKDTKPPRAELLALNVHIGGPFPSAIDFFKNVEDASDYSAKFLSSVDPSDFGEYEIKLELSDKHGNSKQYATTMTVIDDKQPPAIQAPASINGYLGEAVAYTKDVVVTDNCFGEVKLDVDTSAVNIDKIGTYSITYAATDAAGNKTTRTVMLNILAERITEEALMKKIEKLATSLGITSSMTKEEQCRLIYGYVNSPTLSASSANISFIDESNTDRSDWVREAYLTLERGSGDCYSYFAVSKAFFVYFGIENKDIQRSLGVTTQSGTHFWSMVNIGTESSPKWYYYDATRLKYPHSTGSGCLFTEAQLNDYNTNVSRGFLTFDHTGYPSASTLTINTSYTW